jgi:hypothetical protein
MAEPFLVDEPGGDSHRVDDLALALSSSAIIAGDLAGGGKQDVPVMNLVWPLTALYAGPFAVVAYFGSVA